MASTVGPQSLAYMGYEFGRLGPQSLAYMGSEFGRLWRKGLFCILAARMSLAALQTGN